MTRSNPQVTLRPQDLVVLLRLSLESEPLPSYAGLSAELSLTASEIHAGVERAMTAQLVRKDERGKPRIIREPLRLFLQHGVRYCFPATRGELTRGMPTLYAAPPLKDKIVPPTEPVPVWPYKHGSVRGMAFIPLYPTVPEAAARNGALYELLVLVDAIRGGSPRERALAVTMLNERWQD